MDPPEALLYLLKRLNALNNTNVLGPFNGNEFLEAVNLQYVASAIDENQASTSSATASASMTISTVFEPFQVAAEHLKKQDEKYEKLVQHCTALIGDMQTNISSLPPPPKEPPPPPEIAEKLQLFQRSSTHPRSIFLSKLTLEDDGKNIFSRIFNFKKLPLEPEKEEFLGSSLAPFVTDWVIKKSIPIDCKVYSTNDAGEMQIFSCHRTILEQQSIKLKSNIKSMAFQIDDKKILHIPLFEFPAKIVESFLIGCYEGQLHNYQGIYLMAKELRATALMNSANKEMKSNLTITSVVKQFQFAYDNDLYDLMDACIKFAKQEFKYVKYYAQYKNLPANVLHEFAMNVALSPPFLL